MSRNKNKPTRPKAALQVLLHSPLRTPDSPWEIRLFLTEAGRSPVEEWNKAVSVKGRAKRDATLRFLQVQPSARWSRPKASAVGDNVYVIRFTDENGFQHRLYGYQDTPHHAFVICFHGYEQNDEYFPVDYTQRVKQCRTAVGEDFFQRTAPCAWPLD